MDSKLQCSVRHYILAREVYLDSHSSLAQVKMKEKETNLLVSFCC